MRDQVDGGGLGVGGAAAAQHVGDLAVEARVLGAHARGDRLVGEGQRGERLPDAHVRARLGVAGDQLGEDDREDVPGRGVGEVAADPRADPRGAQRVAPVEGGLDEPLLGGEVVLDASGRDVRARRDLGQRHRRQAALGDDRQDRVGDLVPPLLVPDPGPARAPLHHSLPVFRCARIGLPSYESSAAPQGFPVSLPRRRFVGAASGA
ncbi:hypothetical protein BJF79_20540 [Actinomadura sp. CNU-125]|nr:hypothetical protein BJF79_20540 [Actinomadura sp. CNU-125]